jgi:hypothetical protein
LFLVSSWQDGDSACINLDVPLMNVDGYPYWFSTERNSKDAFMFEFCNYSISTGYNCENSNNSKSCKAMVLCVYDD